MGRKRKRKVSEVGKALEVRDPKEACGGTAGNDFRGLEWSQSKIGRRRISISVASRALLSQAIQAVTSYRLPYFLTVFPFLRD